MCHSDKSECKNNEKTNTENKSSSEFLTDELKKWSFLHINGINDTIEYMKKLKNFKHIFVIILICLTILFSYIQLFSDEFSDTMNGFFIYRTGNGVWQDYFHKHTLRPSADDIVIINIDERSLNALQSNNNNLKNLSITKDTYADLITGLESAWVKGIAFDIVFQNADPEYEQNFADTLKKYDNIVIAANYVENFCQLSYKDILSKIKITDNTHKKISNNQCEWEYKKQYISFLKKQRNWETQQINNKENGRTQTETEIENLINKTWALTNSEKLSIFCSADFSGIIDCPGLPRSIYKDTPWGLINTPSVFERILAAPILNQPYQDWKIWSGSHTIADTEFYPLALSLYMQTNTGKTNIVSTLPYYYKPLIRGKSESQYKTILNPFFGAEDVSYRSISLIDVLEMLNKSSNRSLLNFKWKYIFIGESGTLIHDALDYPVTGHKINGVETHAHFLDGLLQNQMLAKAPAWSMWLSSILLIILTVHLYFFLPRSLSLIFAWAVLCSTLWASRYLYDIHRVLVDIFPLFLSVWVATFVTTYTYKFFVVDREKRFIENAFSHYIDPKMVEMIDMEEVAVTLWGEVRELSVFFSDIAGFTSISEKLSPKDLFWLMSLYLSRMTDILKQEWWTLDKYIGDAVMGFFGAPVAQPDHAIRVCRTAVAMRSALAEINDQVAARGIMRIDFRIGISSGEMMVGNIGSSEHFNYTVLGDTVNLASRLEATGKEYNVHSIISEWTRGQIGDRFELRELDTIAVKWKSEWVKIYELLGIIGEIIDRTIYDTYGKALALYRKWKYLEAGKIWESQMETDGPSRVMALRCVEILSGNIRVENGIYTMTHK